MSTQPDESTILALSEAQVSALGGWGDILTWLRWLREKKEFIKPVLAAFEEFSTATTWASRLVAIGRLIDALGAVIATAPEAMAGEIMAMLVPESGDDPDELADWVGAELAAAQADFSASAINWPGLFAKLPQLIGFVQFVAGLVKQFRGPATVAPQSLAVPPVHGLVYRPFANAA